MFCEPEPAPRHHQTRLFFAQEGGELVFAGPAAKCTRAGRCPGMIKHLSEEGGFKRLGLPQQSVRVSASGGCGRLWWNSGTW